MRTGHPAASAIAGGDYGDARRRDVILFIVPRTYTWNMGIKARTCTYTTRYSSSRAISPMGRNSRTRGFGREVRPPGAACAYNVGAERLGNSWILIGFWTSRRYRPRCFRKNGAAARGSNCPIMSERLVHTYTCGRTAGDGERNSFLQRDWRESEGREIVTSEIFGCLVVSDESQI